MKNLRIVLCALLTLTLMLPLAAQASSADNVNPAGVFPIVKEPITLKVAAVINARVSDVETNEYITWLEEQTGIHLEFTQLSSTDTLTQINLMLSSGEDLPDLFIGYSFTYVNLIDYADAGYILPLNEYIEKYGDQFNKRLEEAAQTVNNPLAYISVDGKIYSTPSLTIAYNNAFNECMHINTQWLEKLGLEMPTTLDEFHDVLVAFRDNDPNGNGEADEVPAMGTAASTNIIEVAGCAYQNTNTENYLKVEDGVVSFIANNDKYKATLQYVNKLVSEGLLSPASFTQDKSVMTALMSGDTARVGVMTVGSSSKNSIMDSTMPLYTAYTRTLPLAGPDGFVTAVISPNTIGRGVLITSSCKHPEAAFRLLDFFLSEESSMRQRYGVPGRDWDYVTDKTIIGRSGQPAKYVDYAGLWSKASQNTIMRSGSWGQFLDVVNNLSAVYDPANPNEYNATNAVEAGMRLRSVYRDDGFPEEVLLEAEDAIRFSELQQEIVDFMDEYNVRFITGELNFDADWDQYVQSLSKLGIVDEYVALGQAAIDMLK